jgi:O-antigen ligase
MTVRTINSAKSLTAGLAIVIIGVFVGFITVLGLTFVRPVLLALALGGLIVLIPTFVVRDKRAYWLFLLVLSMPFDVYKRTTSWIVEPYILASQYGLPASGTVSLDVYATDVVLIGMLLPWLARLCLRRSTLYFPNIGYIFLLYLAWALIISLINAPSFYLSILQWCREILYFLSFLYLVNNVITRSQFRAIILALFVGLIIEGGTVITLYRLQIGTETYLLAGLYEDTETYVKAKPHYEAESGAEAHTKRSAGTFIHPAVAAFYFEFTLIMALAYLVAAPHIWDLILRGAIFAGGCVAMYLTFSRSGLVGFVGGTILFIAVARWSRLLSQRAFACYVVFFIISVAATAPLLIAFLESRPETAGFRLILVDRSWNAISQHPIFGVGLNNSSAVLEGALRTVMTPTGSEVQASTVHNHYLIVLMEVGIVGFLLFFAFFGRIGAVALCSIRAADTETKVWLAGIIASLASIAIHILGDGLGAHSTIAMLWLYAALIIAIARRVQAEGALPAPAHGLAVTV